jgi:hypothetical protein
MKLALLLYYQYVEAVDSIKTRARFHNLNASFEFLVPVSGKMNFGILASRSCIRREFT